MHVGCQFLSAIMRRQYAEALKYCQLILQYEPHNATAQGFYPLLRHKLHAHAHAHDETSSSDDTSSKRGALFHAHFRKVRRVKRTLILNYPSVQIIPASRCRGASPRSGRRTWRRRARWAWSKALRGRGRCARRWSWTRPRRRPPPRAAPRRRPRAPTAPTAPTVSSAECERVCARVCVSANACVCAQARRGAGRAAASAPSATTTATPRPAVSPRDLLTYT